MYEVLGKYFDLDERDETAIEILNNHKLVFVYLLYMAIYPEELCEIQKIQNADEPDASQYLTPSEINDINALKLLAHFLKLNEIPNLDKTHLEKLCHWYYGLRVLDCHRKMFAGILSKIIKLGPVFTGYKFGHALVGLNEWNKLYLEQMNTRGVKIDVDFRNDIKQLLIYFDCLSAIIKKENRPTSGGNYDYIVSPNPNNCSQVNPEAFRQYSIKIIDSLKKDASKEKDGPDPVVSLYCNYMSFLADCIFHCLVCVYIYVGHEKNNTLSEDDYNNYCYANGLPVFEWCEEAHIKAFEILESLTCNM